MKRDEKDITLMYGSFVKPERIVPPHVKKRRQKLITIALVVLAVIGLWALYSQPFASVAAVPRLIKRDVKLGATEAGITVYLGFRHMDAVELGGDERSQAIEDALDRRSSGDADFVGDIPDLTAISKVVKGASRPQPSSDPAVTAYFFFDNQGKLVAYYVVEPQALK